MYGSSTDRRTIKAELAEWYAFAEADANAEANTFEIDHTADDERWANEQARDDDHTPDDDGWDDDHRWGLGPDPADADGWDQRTDAEWDAMAGEAEALAALESRLRFF